MSCFFTCGGNKAAQFGKGFLFGTFLVVLWTLRFVDEFFKINQVGFEDSLLLNMGQVLSIPFIVWGIWLVVRSVVRKSETTELQAYADAVEGK